MAGCVVAYLMFAEEVHDSWGVLKLFSHVASYEEERYQIMLSELFENPFQNWDRVVADEIFSVERQKKFTHLLLDLSV